MARTVNIALQDILGVALATPVVFDSLSTPLAFGGFVVPAQSKQVSVDSTGAGSIALQPGRYRVRVLGSVFTCLVPEADGAYALDQISDLTTVFSQANFRTKDGNFQLRNQTTGYWHTLQCDDLQEIATITLNPTGEV